MQTQENENLLNNSDTVQDVQVKASEQVLTEVTSIAKEEAKTGTKINTPTAEELVTRASSSIIVNTRRISELIYGKEAGDKYKISRKGMNRVLLAILNLPTEGVPVNLKTQEEKLIFALGQRLIGDRFILTQYHISEEMKKQRAANETAAQQTKTEDTVQTQGENNE